MAGRVVVHGELAVPGDKSVSHRALMLSALARGRSRIRGLLRSDDIASTAGALRAMGFRVPDLADDMMIEGLGLGPVAAPGGPLDCGNSGTTTRLMMGVAAAHPGTVTFIGDASLSRRPMRRVARPLERMGARVEFAGAADGLPLTVHGAALRPLEWESESASAQVKSALLLAGTRGGVVVRFREPYRSRDHTERMLRAQGVSIGEHDGWIVLEPPGHLTPLDCDVPGDPSAAAFPVALGALAGGGRLVVRGVGLNPGRTGFLDVLRRMGADLVVHERPASGPEPIGDIEVTPAPLRGVDVGGDAIPALIDEIPMLACIAARADGVTTIRDASELRVKESDRIAAVVANLRAVGAEAEELPDGLVVTGSARPLAGHVETHGDHRLAMAFGVLGAVSGGALAIDDPGCVAVSYPAFWRDLAGAIA